MPSGETHTVINLGLLAVIIAAAIIIFSASIKGVVLFAVGFLFSTLFLSPDLDLKDNCSSNNWGFFKLIWRPFSFFSSHRGISHSLIFGPLIKLLYLCAIIFVVFHLADFIVFRNTDIDFITILQNNKKEIICILGGVYLAHVAHVLLDNI
jgi:uncharacterized metal-binding protein